jgi:hypothetical protein
VLRLRGSSRVDWKLDRLCDISTKSISPPGGRSGTHVPIKVRAGLTHAVLTRGLLGGVVVRRRRVGARA